MDDALADVFLAFCGAGRADMDGKSFAKLCKDCNLLDRATLLASEPDLIFARVVTKGQRRIDFDQFNDALKLVAERKGLSEDAVWTTVVDAGGPILTATQANFSRLHDDKSTYTGTHVYIHGGPKLDSSLETSYASARGAAPRFTPASRRGSVESASSEGYVELEPGPRRRSLAAAVPPAHERMEEAAPRRRQLAGTSFASRGEQDDDDDDPSYMLAPPLLTPAEKGPLEQTFDMFRGKVPGMDGKSFAKLCKDCGLIDTRTFYPSDPDLIFARVVTKGQRRIYMPQFESALELVAERKGIPSELVYRAVVDVVGPVMNATATHGSRLHDDKSTYTGTHVHGSLQTVGDGRRDVLWANEEVGENAGPSAATGTALSSSITFDDWASRPKVRPVLRPVLGAGSQEVIVAPQPVMKLNGVSVGTAVPLRRAFARSASPRVQHRLPASSAAAPSSPTGEGGQARRSPARPTVEDPYGLRRFLEAQRNVYDQVWSELRAGKKASHWMWFVFPQIRGLGHSHRSAHYGINSLDEARAYLAQAVLGLRLRMCTVMVREVKGKTAAQIFGGDDVKFRSCMTLFDVVESQSVFAACLDKFFNGDRDMQTLRLVTGG